MDNEFRRALQEIADPTKCLTLADCRQRAELALGVVKPAAPKPAPFALSAKLASRYEAYSDGACSGNPGPAAWGVVVLGDGVLIHEGSGFLGDATNQIAEIEAAIAALQLVPEGAQVELVSDSQYVVKGISEWRKGWERNAWRNAAGQPVANQHQWKRLFTLVDARKVTATWVRGHNGHPFNSRCDQLATGELKARS